MNDSIGPAALHSKTLRVVAGWVAAAFVAGGSLYAWRSDLVTRDNLATAIAASSLDIKRVAGEQMVLEGRMDVAERKLQVALTQLHAARRSLVQYHAQRTCPARPADAAWRALERFDREVSGGNDEATAFQTVLFLKWCP